MLITLTSKALKVLSLFLSELSLLTDQDKDGRTLMNLISMKYCEGMELVTQVVTDSSYEFLLICGYDRRLGDVSGYSLIPKRH
jgi:hypothetical protein